MNTNVLFIAYNSTITGSKALRVYNNHNKIQRQLYTNTNTIMSKYCQLYDLSKKNEPYYDVLGSQIAMLNQSTFDTYFEYIPVHLTQSGKEHNSFHPSQKDPLKFKMISKTLNNAISLSRYYLDTFFDYSYNTTEHIFIYGPITDIILQELIDKINTVIIDNTKLVIHFQGENILNNQGNDGDMIFGMESKGNLFKNSFNYQNSMKNSQTFRNFIETNPNCEALTVICKTNPELYIDNIDGDLLKFPLNNDGVIIKNGLPKIYVTFYEHIANLLNDKLINNNNFYNILNITKIYQDLVDKDNITSVIFMLINTLDINNCSLYLIGREAFNLTYNDEIIPHYQSMNFSCVPDNLKPNNILENHKNIELNMASTNQYYWPEFKDTKYKLVYNKILTQNHYILMTECFKIAIKNVLEIYNLKYDNIIINKDTLIPNPSINENKLCLLNEILFYPSLNTYITSINNINQEYLSNFNNKLSNIKNTNTYLSDIELHIFN